MFFILLLLCVAIDSNANKALVCMDGRHTPFSGTAFSALSLTKGQQPTKTFRKTTRDTATPDRRQQTGLKEDVVTASVPGDGVRPEELAGQVLHAAQGPRKTTRTPPDHGPGEMCMVAAATKIKLMFRPIRFLFFQLSLF